MLKIEKLHLDYEEKLYAVYSMPQISWKVISDKRNDRQTAYRIQISCDKEFAAVNYDTLKVDSGQSAHIFPDGVTLQPLTKYYLRAKVSNGVEWSEFGEPAWFVTSLMGVPWSGKFISAESEHEGDCSKGTYLRKTFTVKKRVKHAFFCATALGLYRLHMNGEKVGDYEFTPGWTSYHKHHLYQVYDVKKHLLHGENAIGVEIGAGWYKGVMGFLGRRNNYGNRTAFLGEMHIVYEDETKEIVYTDTSWKGAPAPVLFSEIYDGELYDACYEIEGFSEAKCQGGIWSMAEIIEQDLSVLRPQREGLVKAIDCIPAQRIFVTKAGDTVIDFGQNLTGWVEITASGKKGDRIVYRCFEVLDKEGNVYTENLRTAKQEICYIFKQDGQINYHPHFTYQGFRYLCIDEFPEPLDTKCFMAYSLHTKMEPTGFFECSNPDINQLHHNILWGFKGNSLDIPTDCPQRNERVGWTGDAQIFCRTSCYLENVYHFFSKWLTDLAADQMPEGGVPHVVPDIISGHEQDDWLLSQGTHSAAAWADVGVIIPWTLYLAYGDTQILRVQYDSMKKWIQFMEKHAKDYIWNYKLQFGDWLALDAEEGSYFGATPNDLTCTAYFAYSTHLMMKISKILEEDDDAARLELLHKKIVEKYQETFFDNQGHLNVQTQTAQIVSLYFDLVPEQYKKKVTGDLCRLLEKEKGHLVTGFVGTPYFCQVLSDNGHLEEAYNLLLKDDFPSWLYQVKMGATTVWEHWDGMKPDGSMWSPDMNSFNHYAYGAIGEWLYRSVAGIETDEQNAGYKHALIQPHIGGSLTYANGKLATIYGDIQSSWKVKDKLVVLNVTIPFNTTASIHLKQAGQILETDGIEFIKQETGYWGDIGSGSYEICFRLISQERKTI